MYFCSPPTPMRDISIWVCVCVCVWVRVRVCVCVSGGKIEAKSSLALMAASHFACFQPHWPRCVFAAIVIKITLPSSSLLNPPHTHSNSNSLIGIDCLSSHLKLQNLPPSFHSLPFRSIPPSPLSCRSPFSFLISRAGSSPSLWVIKMRAGRLKKGGREREGGREARRFERPCVRDEKEEARVYV